jgi:hypothetical protein
MALKDRAESEPQVKWILDNPEIDNVTAGEALQTSEASVRRYRKKSGWVRAEGLHTEAPVDGAEMEIEGDEGWVYTGPLPEPITDETGWAPVLRLLGIGDPENWYVVDDTVKASTWQQSKGLDDGTRTTVLLYSYRARIARRTASMQATEDEIAEAVARVQVRKTSNRRIPGSGLGSPVGYVHHQGDEQIGKDKNNGGIEELQWREEVVLERSIETLEYHLKRGTNVTEILDNSAGDRIENIFGHYPSQGRTSATLRNQKSYATESDIVRTEAFAAFDLPITKVYTPSNHGEMRQVLGQSSFSSESDNWDLIIAEDVQRVLDRSPLAEQITWHIPHDEWMTLFNFAGVNIGASHGHKADGKNLQRWALGQRDMFNFHDDFRMQIMLLGHKHHFHIEDVGGTVLIQSSTLDSGSKYFEAGMGNRSIGGALGFLVGAHFKTGFDSLTFL